MPQRLPGLGTKISALLHQIPANLAENGQKAVQTAVSNLAGAVITTLNDAVSFLNSADFSTLGTQMQAKATEAAQSLSEGASERAGAALADMYNLAIASENQALANILIGLGERFHVDVPALAANRPLPEAHTPPAPTEAQVQAARELAEVLRIAGEIVNESQTLTQAIIQRSDYDLVEWLNNAAITMANVEAFTPLDRYAIATAAELLLTHGFAHEDAVEVGQALAAIMKNFKITYNEPRPAEADINAHSGLDEVPPYNGR